MKNVTVLDHPLIEHKLSILRDKHTGTKLFRELVGEIGAYLVYEAMRDVPLEETVVETPIKTIKMGRLNEDNYAFAPIMRAGMGLLDGVLKVIPNAKIAHVGMYRDEETFEPVNYFFKAPEDIGEREVIILDPMLATGGSACDAIELFKQKGVKKMRFICLIAAPEGIDKVVSEHPDVPITVAHIDDCLNENKYIVPGLGDAGDRIFGTK
ncbi:MULTISPECIES: uracil phosphoribosyltransferase [unclassified Butyrivibrio]|jgi:uracil phosphoribosyltransferase|uniref:uracil phosphoribosyltransferase n=1 Tax=unclassified Butyrivibrio TaxID=2639466 RepID=UPI00042305FA|nr:MULTISPECIES: uracil phosphoribosyltransferase [unclassified Butyrivibrio]MCR5344330.1 uracil phosphoribosyltransferase [Butyrivibrio sp.]